MALWHLLERVGIAAMRTLLVVRKPPVVPVVAWLRRVINTESRSSALGAAGCWERRCRELRQPERHGISKARRAPMVPGPAPLGFGPPAAVIIRARAPGSSAPGPGDSSETPDSESGPGRALAEPGLGNAGRPGIMADLATGSRGLSGPMGPSSGFEAELQVDAPLKARGSKLGPLEITGRALDAAGFGSSAPVQVPHRPCHRPPRTLRARFGSIRMGANVSLTSSSQRAHWPI
jgi:hypothetical protein